MSKPVKMTPYKEPPPLKSVPKPTENRRGDGVVTRGNGAATKGIRARGPLA